jgi:WXXGXW repeat (2 copies)
MRISNPSGPASVKMTISKHLTLKSFLLASTMLASPMIAAALTPAAAQVAIGISVQIAPPILPVYEQPPMPEAGYIWTPGYWAWAQPAGYYWVPGTWVMPPTVGVLWTPPYWGWNDGAYVFYDGYWGPQVGYYGGVDYGYGYGGSGYEGGRWENGGFVYNRTVNNFGSVHVAHDYDQKVTVTNNSKVSFVGGTGGLKNEPTAQERAAEKDHHVPATTEQSKHFTAAATNPALAASHNKGQPAIAATSRPGQFDGPGVVHGQAAGADEHKTENTVAPRPTGHPTALVTPRPARTAPTQKTEGHPAAPQTATHSTPDHQPLTQHQAARPAPQAAAHPAQAKPTHAATAPTAHPAMQQAEAPRAAPAGEAPGKEIK